MSFNQKSQMPRVVTVVLAGGQGTRLYPLTLHRCKPAVCFGGHYRLIDVPISNSIHSNIRKIFVISQYFASSLQQHLSATYCYTPLSKDNLEMLCPEETADGIHWFQGTADAVRQNLSHLLATDADYFLILSGDQLYNIDLTKMIDSAINTSADLIIASLPVDESSAKRMGLLNIDSSFKICDFFEKPSDPKILSQFSYQTNNRYLGSMGIYVFKREALVSLLSKEGNDFGKDLIPLMIKEGRSFTFIHDGYWEDIGTVDSYYQASLSLTRQEYLISTPMRPIYSAASHLPSPHIEHTTILNSILGPGCTIRAKSIQGSVIGMGADIGSQTEIIDSVILGNPSKIGTGCLIQKTIIDENVCLGNDVCLTNKKNLNSYDGDGIFIRDGIIIVSSGTTIPDGFCL